MALVDGISPEWVYAIKGNIKFPGTQAQATAGEASAQSRANDAYGPATVTVPAGSIKVANP